MNTRIFSTMALVVFLAAVPVPAQVLPTNAISSVPFTINAPGFYYATGNLTGSAGITIAVGGVTLDLQGYALTGSAGNSGTGILIQGNISNLAIRNGTIRSWGVDGVVALNAWNGRLEGLEISNNARYGAWVNNSWTITNCQAFSNKYGFLGAFACLITNCTASNNSSEGFGLVSGTISDCVASLNGEGIGTGGLSTIIGCTVVSNTQAGIVTTGGNILNNTCSQNGTNSAGAGIDVVGGISARIEGNSVYGNGIGIKVPSTGHLIIRNFADDNLIANYSVINGNIFGPIVTAATVGTNTNPHANYQP